MLDASHHAMTRGRSVQTFAPIRGHESTRQRGLAAPAHRAVRELALAWCGLLLSASSQAAGLFKSCDEIQADQSFKALTLYFADHPEAHPMECLALDRDSFVFTSRGNFQDCRIAPGWTALQCDPPSPSRWYPDLDLVAHFSGGGKSFALFEWGHLVHGAFSKGYSVVYLVPRHIDPRGYRIVDLKKAALYDEADGSGACADPADFKEGLVASDAVKAGDPPFEILRDGRRDVTLQFRQQTVHCPQGETADRTISYRWTGDRFIETTLKSW